jgi:hypothetical protein
VASEFQPYTDEETALMRLAFEAAWKRLSEAGGELLEPSRVQEIRDLLGLKIIDLVRQVPPDVGHLSDEGLRHLGFVSVGVACHRA